MGTNTTKTVHWSVFRCNLVDPKYCIVMAIFQWLHYSGLMKYCGLQGVGPLFRVINDSKEVRRVHGGACVATDLYPVKNDGKGRKGGKGGTNDVIVDWYSESFGTRKQSLTEDEVTEEFKDLFMASPILEIKTCRVHSMRKSIARLSARCWCTDLDAHKAGMWSKSSTSTNLYHDFGLEDQAIYRENPTKDPLFGIMCWFPTFTLEGYSQITPYELTFRPRPE
jgi:hypothetical protein